MSQDQILTINAGSSSLKLGIYTQEATFEKILLEGSVEAIGEEHSKWSLKDLNGSVIQSGSQRFTCQVDALEQLVERITKHFQVRLQSVGHRVVHGGPQLTRHQLITDVVMRQLKDCVHFAPLHIPAALALIEKVREKFPGTKQFACFDTAFHSTMPEIASRLPLPERIRKEGVRRFGFHGLSYESIVDQLGSNLPSRTVIAHLGGGELTPKKWTRSQAAS